MSMVMHHFSHSDVQNLEHFYAVTHRCESRVYLANSDYD